MLGVVAVRGGMGGKESGWLPGSQDRSHPRTPQLPPAPPCLIKGS